MTEKIDLGEIKDIADSIGGRKENIVAILHAVHKKYNYLPEEALECLAEVTDIHPTDITGIATFYSQFRLKPAGRYFIKVCIGTACHVKGAMDLYDDFIKYLDIPDGEDTDNEKLFTVSKVACLGCCMLAPAVQIDDITYGHVTTPEIPNILRDFLESIKSAESAAAHTLKQDSTGGSIKICTCSSCVAAGSGNVYSKMQEIIGAAGIPAVLKEVGCTGISFQAPLVEIETQDKKIFRYALVKADDAAKIVYNHFRPKKLAGRIRQRIYSLLEKIYTDEGDGGVLRYIPGIRDKSPHDYVDMQNQIATQNSGKLDPLDIDEYINCGGFNALNECLTQNDPDAIIEIIKKSGLRGRGGAGFQTSVKWINVKDSKEKEKFVICNGDEGDPGAFMDRMLLESFPFRVIEGMAVAAFAIGIKKGFIYIRAEYPLAVMRIKEALRICAEKGILENNPANGSFRLDIKVAVSAGAFVCGEETALIASIEGSRGTPHFRPPYPSEHGLWGKPTLVNNVETFALVPWIVLNGGERFSDMGTPSSRGTKTFALAGKINNGGLIEVQMGTTLRDIIYKIGGGLKDNANLKAIQIGGPSGGCLPASLIDTPVDYEELKKLGAIMGSGGIIVLDEEDCIVDVAKYFMSFTRNESCGKCTFCRIGTKRMLEMLEDITEGKGSPQMLERLKSLAMEVKQGSLCGLGRAAPNPVLSALKYFEEEFKAHLDGRCPAKKCKSLITYRITDKCIGCTKCAQRCPQDAIGLRPYEQHEIDQELCIKCDTCRQNCPSEAIVRE